MEIASLFKSLADDTRTRILNLLMHHELNVNEIVSAMGMGQSRISRHLKILTDSGFLTSRRDGLWIFYRAAGAGRSGEMLESLGGIFSSDRELARDLQNLEKMLEEGVISKRRYFDAIASEWDFMKNEILGGLNLSSEIMGRVDRCGTAADIGCGTGELLKELAGKAGRVIGIDNSSNMLAEASRRLSDLGPAVELRLGSVEHLPMRDREADAVVLNMVLHHVTSPAGAIAEADRVLRDGGVLVVADLDKHGDEEMRTRYNHRWLGFDRDEVRVWFGASGFSVEEEAGFPVARGLEVVLYRAVKSAVQDRAVSNSELMP